MIKFQRMVPYLATYTITILLGYFSSKINNKYFRFLLCVIAIMPLVILSGMRDATIGADTSDYPLTLYNYSLLNPLGTTIDRYGNELDVCFVAWSWGITKVFRDFNVLLGTYQLLGLLCVAYVLNFDHPKHIALGLLVYCCFYYLTSLTLIRQYLSYSILLWAYHFAKKRNLPVYLFLVIFATGFHRSGILGLVIWPLFSIIQLPTDVKKYQKQNVYLKILFLVFLMIILGLVVAFGDMFVNLLAPTKESYQFQVDRLGTGKLAISSVVVVAFNVGIFLVFISDVYRKNTNTDQAASVNVRVLFMLCLISFILGLASLSVISLQRVGMGFFIFYSLYYCQCVELTTKLNEKLFLIVLIITISCSYFAYLCLNSAAYVSFPYTSSVLSNLLGIKI